MFPGFSIQFFFSFYLFPELIRCTPIISTNTHTVMILKHYFLLLCWHGQQGPGAQQWGQLRTAVLSQDGKPHHCLGISWQEPHWPDSVLYPAPAFRPQELIFNIKIALEMFKKIDLWHKNCWPHPPRNLKVRKTPLKNCLFSSQTFPFSTFHGN